MAGLFRKDPAVGGPKYLVKRRDGTIPAWPYFVLAAADPAAPVAILAYADAAELYGWDPKYVADLRDMAAEFVAYRAEHGAGDPDAPRHRVDDPAIVAEMKNCLGA